MSRIAGHCIVLLFYILDGKDIVTIEAGRGELHVFYNLASILRTFCALSSVG